MTKSVALLYIAFADVLLLGQTLSPGEANPPVTNPQVNWFERLSKRFPPELVAPIKGPGAATLMRSYSHPLRRVDADCVYPSLASRSLSIRPCRTSPRKLRLLPPFERIAPTTKPATPPDEIR